VSLLGQGRRDDLPESLPEFAGINRYWDRQHDSFVAKILPGEFYVTRGQEAVVTVLGSCVSACVRDRVFKIGGMNHFMLPVDKGQEYHDMKTDLLSGLTRYGNFAMESLINTILKYGGRRENLEIKIFGGGRIIRGMTDVGDSNIRFVHDYIRMENLQLVAEDVGDIFPRKVIYFPETGKVRVKKLRSIHNDTIVSRESRYMQEIKQPAAGEVELF
jgi:chemotaxis protein CheD